MPNQPPKCVFCDHLAVFVLPNLWFGDKPAFCCRRCGNLTATRNWKRLAHRWLLHRPQDWVDDVAAFLEIQATPGLSDR
jgi:hypothetical protein